MKKFLLAVFFILFGCSQISSNDDSILDATKEKNPECMNMRRFRVFQVIESNYALAHECASDYDKDFCIGAVVLLTPQRNIDYYDDMYVSVPKDKCAIQNGVYQYVTKNENLKTVPVIRFDYEFSPSSEEEYFERIYEFVEDARYECKLVVVNNKKWNTKANLKKCDCVFDSMINKTEELKNKNLPDTETVKKNLVESIEKKCGKLPDFVK